jgi:hypothetical protein
VNDLTEEHNENAFDSMCVNSDSISNNVDECELQCEKQDAQKI